jgi:hypothetical protein
LTSIVDTFIKVLTREIITWQSLEFLAKIVLLSLIPGVFFALPATEAECMIIMAPLLVALVMAQE